MRGLPVPDILLAMRIPPNKKSPYTPLSVWRKMSLISQKNPYRFWNFIILRTECDVNRVVKFFCRRRKDACSVGMPARKFVIHGEFPRRPCRNCASSAAFHSRAAESVSCTVCRMCGGATPHAVHTVRGRVFSESANQITLLKQRNSGLRPLRYCLCGIRGRRQSGIAPRLRLCSVRRTFGCSGGDARLIGEERGKYRSFPRQKLPQNCVHSREIAAVLSV